MLDISDRTGTGISRLISRCAHIYVNSFSITRVDTFLIKFFFTFILPDAGSVIQVVQDLSWKIEAFDLTADSCEILNTIGWGSAKKKDIIYFAFCLVSFYSLV